MKENSPNKDLYQHLAASRGISLVEAAHLVDEILSYYQETCDSYIRRRHYELQAAGLSNSRIYQVIQSELELRRFPTPLTSERQIRRVIYG